MARFTYEGITVGAECDFSDSGKTDCMYRICKDGASIVTDLLYADEVRQLIAALKRALDNNEDPTDAEQKGGSDHE